MVELQSGTDAPGAGSRHLDARIFLLAGALFATSTDALVVVGILPLIAADINADPGAIGALLTVYMVTFAIGSPILTVAFANWQRDKLVAASLLIFSVTAFASALAPGYIALLALRVVAACCSAIYVPLAFAAASDLSPADRRSTGLAIATLGLVGSQLIGVPISTWVGQAFGWRAAFAFDGCLVLLIALAYGLRRSSPLQQTGNQPDLRARISPLGNAVILRAVLPVLFWGIGFSIVYSYCAVLMEPKVGFEKVPLLLVSAGLGGIVGSQITSRMTDRFGPVGPIIGFVSLNAANIAVLNWSSESFAGAAAAMFILTFCHWGIFIPQQTRLLAIEPVHGPTVISLSNSVIYFGMGVGAAIGAALVSHQWLAALSYTGSAAYLLALACFLLSLKLDERPRTSAPARPA